MAFLAATDRERARSFYVETLGLELAGEDPFALFFELGAERLRIVIVDGFTPQPYTVLGWDVPDLRGTVLALGAAGVRFERFEGLDQDDAGAWTSPSGARIAWFKDPEGNLLSLGQDSLPH